VLASWSTLDLSSFLPETSCLIHCGPKTISDWASWYSVYCWEQVSWLCWVNGL